MNLEELKNKTILLFGKSRAFSKEEFISQLKVHQITLAKELSDEVSLIIDGKMMTPYEQNESEKLYEQKLYEFVEIDVFEKELASHLNEDALLMSLKLSANKERLKSFIQNTTISDTLFFKLLKMYKWGDDDFFESDDNRDVSAAFISRFYENIERNHNVQYATTGYVHLIQQKRDAQLLEVIYSLKPIQHNPKMKMHLAMHEYASSDLLNKLLQEKSAEIREALSLNPKLPLEIVQSFLQEESLAQNIAKNRELDAEYFELLQEYQTSLALNETLTKLMQRTLYESENEEVHYALSLNDALDAQILDALLQSTNQEIKMALYENKTMPIEKLQEAYQANEYHAQLAKNEATPIEILYQLQLDARYERAVKTNASFGKNIQSQNIGWL